MAPPHVIVLSDGTEVELSAEMQEKLAILMACGFRGSDPAVVSTLLNQYPRNPNDKYRTKCFIREADRIRAHRQVVKRSKGLKSQETPSEQNDEDLAISIDDLDAKVYEPPIPIVPFPHRGKHVLPDGFVRDEPNLAQKVLRRYEKWFRSRGCSQDPARQQDGSPAFLRKITELQQR